MSSQSVGGISSNSRISAYPMVNVNGQAGLYAFDPSLGFNDPNNPANYTFRIEEFQAGTTATINQIIVTYRDLGLVTVTFTLTGTNDDQKVVTNSTTIKLGNLVPTGRIMTLNNIGLTLNGQNLQLSLSRAANAGNLAIVKIAMTGQLDLTEGK